MNEKEILEELYDIHQCRALQKQIYRLGVNWSYRGFGQSLEAALLLAQDESLLACMKIIYIDVAKRNRTEKRNVERDIRTFVQAIWKYGDREALEEMAGRKLEKPPTCQEFIKMLADGMRRTLA